MPYIEINPRMLSAKPETYAGSGLNFRVCCYKPLISNSALFCHKLANKRAVLGGVGHALAAY